MKILVTGATGYIGGAAARDLRAAGHKVSGLARSEASAAKLTQVGLSPIMGPLRYGGELDVLAWASRGGACGGSFWRPRRMFFEALAGVGQIPGMVRRG
jgi:NAD(P)-dependent dehydrogenase (short-subunit alcohol dehydrogenase family)